MIQANELRIGNWVKHHNGYMRIYAPDFDDNYFLGACEPILLTPEILEKAGFVIENGCRWNEAASILLTWGDESPHYYSFKYNLIADSVKIRHLHHLQNLYHSLTGKEIEVIL